MTAVHDTAHPQAGETVLLNFRQADRPTEEVEFRIEDWWDRLTGESWMNSTGNPAALIYAIHVGTFDLPLNDEVVYGKIGSMGYLLHVSELPD